MTYPDYTRAERIADGIVHVLGVTAALSGVAILFALVADQLPWSTFWAVVVYALALVTMLCASAAYHLAAHTPARPLLRRIDHAAIYVKIAGTLTPLGALLGSVLGYVTLGLIWALALIGAALKLRAAPDRMGTEWLPQVALGWMGLVLLVPLWPSLPQQSVILILSGGLIYSGAVVFYCWESLRYSNAIWHACVLAATACCFLGITAALSAPPLI